MALKPAAISVLTVLVYLGFATLLLSFPHAQATCREKDIAMCRNIKTLFNFEPPASREEIHASALQFVRKLSGFNRPSAANAAAFNRAVSDVSDVARRLLEELQTNAPARDREIEAEKARERSRVRFG